MNKPLMAIAVAGALAVSGPAFAKYYIYKPAPRLVVAAANAPVALTSAVSAANLTGDFGATASSVVTITNPNTVAANLGTISATGVTIDTAGSTCGSSLPANGSCTVKVQGVVGMTDYAGALTFGNSLLNNTQTVNFTVQYIDPHAGKVVYFNKFDGQSDSWVGGTANYVSGFDGNGFAPNFIGGSRIQGGGGANLGSGEWTVEAYVKPSIVSQGQIFGYHQMAEACNWMLFVDTSERLSFHFGNSGNITSGSTPLALGVWHHVAVARNAAGTLRFFVNGNLIATNNSFAGQPVPAPSVPFSIGNDVTNRFPFKGAIDNARITVGADRSNGGTTISTVIR